MTKEDKADKIPTTCRILVAKKVLYARYDVVVAIRELVIQCNMKYVCAKGQTDELLRQLQNVAKVNPEWFAKSSLVQLPQ